MRKTYLFALFISYTLSLSFALSSNAQQQSPNTYLVPVGGGKINDTLLLKIVELSNVKNPSVLVIPYAASLKDVPSAIKGSTTMLNRIGVKNIEVLDTSDPVKSAALIESCDVIWMSGGGQYRLRLALERAGLADKIVDRYKRGNVIIAGTSAGASVMTDIMMSKSIKDKATGSLTPELSYGLKLWPEVIIDQHFSERKRLERLQKAMVLNKGLLGIGIDEGTSIFYKNDGKITVWGKGTVSFVKHDPNSNKLKTKVLKDGEIYPL